jgi:hypothetical protein
MSVAQAFPPLGQEYEPFLYAVVCDEGDGMPLTVVSAIARSGADPWKEAARIARLPKAVALEALACMIPVRGDADGAAIANRLLSLLPSAREEIRLPFVGARTAAPRASLLIPAAIALLLTLAIVAYFRQTPAFNATQPPPAPSAPVADKADPVADKANP